MACSLASFFKNIWRKLLMMVPSHPQIH
uniref:Uncharacterized protein n=1 Tax=Anguilla anguilla TaxID=7936 RepID=A0A0E9VB04_ANGAN